MSAIQVDFNGALLTNYLSQVLHRVKNTRPILHDIGELLTETTKRRFSTSTGPDGRKWAPNKPSTLEQYMLRISGAYARDGRRLGNLKGYYDKSGRATKKTANRLAAKKPLIGESKTLSTTIFYQVTPGAVRIGSPMVYSAIQQYGGSRNQHPNLWGDIPARPFLGISRADRESILAIVAGYLS